MPTRCVATAIVAFCVLTATAEAADVRVVASAEPSSVAVGGTVTYEISVTIVGPLALTLQPEPSLPDLSAFEIVSTGTRQDLRMGSGGTQSTRTYTYTLRATRAGGSTVQPATVEVAGQVYRSGTVQINVTGGSTPAAPPVAPPSPQPGPPPSVGENYTPRKAVDLRLTAEPRNPYVGQQVILTFTFYQSQNLGDTRYEPPQVENCVSKELPHPDSTTQVFGGTDYLVQERRWAVFPATSGRLPIEPVKVTTATLPLAPPEELQTNPIELSVRQLPPAPAGKQFEGAVGNFTAQLATDRTSVKAGESFTITLTIRGAGNLHSLGALTPKVPDWVNLYKSREDRSSAPGYGGNPDLVGGEGRFEFLALAKRQGTVSVPPMEFVYFEPTRGRYEIARTNGVTIEVTKGAVAEPSPTEEAEQMRHIVTGGPGRPARVQLVGMPLFWGLHVLPLLVLAVLGYMSHRTNALRANPRLARSLSAPRVAQAHLRAAHDALKRNEAERFCTCVSHAITDFIAHRAGLQAADITREDAVARLREAGIDADLVARVAALLQRCDYGRFARAEQAECDEMLRTARALIAELHAVKLEGR